VAPESRSNHGEEAERTSLTREESARMACDVTRQSSPLRIGPQVKATICFINPTTVLSQQSRGRLNSERVLSVLGGLKELVMT
jgi:hypothetical protein